jgi:cell division protein FtsW
MSTAARNDLQLAGLHLDPVMLTLTAALAGLGMVIVLSASIAVADRELGQPFYYLWRHGGALLVGLLAAAFCLWVPTALWFRLSGVLLLLGLALLALVLVPGVGHSVNGATRWLKLGLVNLQVSELARLAILVYLAGYVVRHQTELSERLFGLVKPMAVVVVAVGLLIAEPDYGAAVVLTATSLGVLFVGGANLRGFVVAVMVAIAGLALLAVSAWYRVQRLTTFMDPWADPFESGFQLTQSLIAIGRGELTGVGLGASVQKLFYLPEAHTDFVFAVLGEEFGFIGVALTLLLFGWLIWRIVQLAMSATAAGMPFQGCLAFSIGLWLALQTLINMGVNTGMLPTKGLTLPLLSYGRTSVVATLTAIGLLLRIHHEVSLATRDGGARRRRGIRS